jgi:hypothetical protein
MPLPNMMLTFSPLICADHRRSDRSARLLGHRLQLRPIGTDVRDLVGDAQMNYPQHMRKCLIVVAVSGFKTRG